MKVSLDQVALRPFNLSINDGLTFLKGTPTQELT